MEDITKYLADHGTPAFSISVDDATKENIEAPFIRNRELLAAGIFSKENVLDCLATTEFSEWNDLFIYVVNSFKEERQFMSVAAKMQLHLKDIGQFMGSLPEGLRHLYIIKSLPRVWEEHILIIDDDQLFVEFLKKLLWHEGKIETAQNGREGLQKIKETYFDLIISDIYMPLMDGIEFYNKASAYDPEIRKRIMFISGVPKREHTDFFKKNNFRYLIKPAPIRDIVRNAFEILHKTELKK
jgi:CheY-like chemotaxis protein